MRKLFAFSSIMVLIFCLGISVNSAIGENFPGLIPLPDGFRPEGVVVGKGLDIYAGSLANGSIYRADLRTGQGEIIIVPPQDGIIAVGLSFDRRSNFLFVAGGPAGAGYVYDIETGVMVAEYQLTTEGPTFINDVIVTRSAAYFTDSFRPFFYRIPLGPAGELPDAVDFEEIPLTGDFIPVPGFNANGIDATPNGKSLLIVNSSSGELYHVEPETGIASMVDLGGPNLLGNGDGILLDGMTLYVVQNRLNQVAVVQLDNDLIAGEIVETITSPAFDVPTTITEFGNFLYLVNARFGIPTPGTETYDIVKVTK